MYSLSGLNGQRTLILVAGNHLFIFCSKGQRRGFAKVLAMQSWIADWMMICLACVQHLMWRSFWGLQKLGSENFNFFARTHHSEYIVKKRQHSDGDKSPSHCSFGQIHCKTQSISLPFFAILRSWFLAQKTYTGSTEIRTYSTFAQYVYTNMHIFAEGNIHIQT